MAVLLSGLVEVLAAETGPFIQLVDVSHALTEDHVKAHALVEDAANLAALVVEFMVRSCAMESVAASSAVTSTTVVFLVRTTMEVIEQVIGGTTMRFHLSSTPRSSTACPNCGSTRAAHIGSDRFVAARASVK